MELFYLTDNFAKVFFYKKHIGFAEQIDGEWIFYPVSCETDAYDTIQSAVYSLM